MTRPSHIWLIFTFCLAVLLAATGWVSVTAFRLDREQQESRRVAAFEEKVRLALWRMDSVLTPLIVQESSRPYFAYSAFYPVERAYSRMFNKLQQGEVLVPSPLLVQGSANVLLHFQHGPDGQLTSPQIPDGDQRLLAEPGYLSEEQIALASGRLAQLQSWLNREALQAACAISPAKTNEPPRQATPSLNQVQQAQNVQSQSAQQNFLNTAELQARAQSYQRAVSDNFVMNSAPARGNIAEGMLQPIWFGDRLVLARSVSVAGREYLQGCWLDWSNIKHVRLDGLKDLLPGANLEPLPANAADQQSRKLAALPVRFTPGSLPQDFQGEVSPVRLALIIAWACVLLAAFAVAVLLHGAVSLSERRGAFVSAVTHELRTPLTTFRMYTEMLSTGMVPDGKKRADYLDTLRKEAERLSHLVENVLAYARLERGSARSRVESVALAQLIERAQGRLAERTEQGNMSLVVQIAEPESNIPVRVDTSAVEQILFNLVDNACKYAASATERIIHLEVASAGKMILLSVRDYVSTGKRLEDFSTLFPNPRRKQPGARRESAWGWHYADSSAGAWEAICDWRKQRRKARALCCNSRGLDGAEENLPKW